MGAKLLAAAQSIGVSVTDTLGTDDALELGSIIFEGNVRFLTAGPVVAVVVQGRNAVLKTRQLCGATVPCDAAPGTIRGDFGSAGVEQVWMGEMTVRNLVHASEDLAEAGREIALWFPRG
jgi:nucleoside-diphosphate kinase